PGCAGHRRGADCDRHRFVCRHSRGGRVQPLHARCRPAGNAVRDVHRGILEHSAAAGVIAMRRPRKSINQINVVPYIDVMLVLLVIFMVTAPLITPGEMQLPSVGSKLTTPISPLKIYVKRDLSLTLQEGAAPPSAVSRQVLVAR